MHYYPWLGILIVKLPQICQTLNFCPVSEYSFCPWRLTQVSLAKEFFEASQTLIVCPSPHASMDNLTSNWPVDKVHLPYTSHPTIYHGAGVPTLLLLPGWLSSRIICPSSIKAALSYSHILRNKLCALPRWDNIDCHKNHPVSVQGFNTFMSSVPLIKEALTEPNEYWSNSYVWILYLTTSTCWNLSIFACIVIVQSLKHVWLTTCIPYNLVISYFYCLSPLPKYKFSKDWNLCLTLLVSL